MAYRPKPWPDKAIIALENTLSHLKNIERASALAQQAVIDGNPLEAVKTMSDIRTQAMLSHSILVEARAGKYQE